MRSLEHKSALAKRSFLQIKIGVVDLMPGEPVDLRTEAFGQCNSLPERVVRRRRVAFTNSETRVSSPPFLASILDSLLPEIDRHERLETAVSRGHSIPRARPILSMGDRKSTRLNSSHSQISYAVFCLKKKKSLVRDIDDDSLTLATPKFSPGRKVILLGVDSDNVTWIGGWGRDAALAISRLLSFSSAI